MRITKREDMFALSWSKKIRAITMLGGCCETCKCDDPIVLDFHHIGEKGHTINQLRWLRWSKIEREVKKCMLLCSNCHMEHHCVNGKHSKIKEEFCLSKRFERCSKCEYKGENLSSLDFHHIGKKRFEISDALYGMYKASVQEINDELKQCIVLCRNCHRKEHFNYERLEKLTPLIEKKMNTHKELREKIDRSLVKEKILSGYRQVDIAKELNCSKGTISGIVKELKKKKEI